MTHSFVCYSSEPWLRRPKTIHLLLLAIVSSYIFYPIITITICHLLLFVNNLVPVTLEITLEDNFEQLQKRYSDNCNNYSYYYGDSFFRSSEWIKIVTSCLPVNPTTFLLWPCIIYFWNVKLLLFENFLTIRHKSID